jgi:translocation and assembly module TamB
MSDDLPRSRRLRAIVIAAASAIAVAALVLLGAAYVASSRTVVAMLDYAVERSGGRLAYEGARGSVFGTMYVDRLQFRDGTTRVVAEDVEIALSPRALLESRLVLPRVAARRVEVEFPPGEARDTPIPASLALPLPIDVARILIGRVDWKEGLRQGVLDGVSLSYAGDADGHRVRDLDVRAPGATLTGTIDVGASPPFTVGGSARLALDAPHPRGRVEATLGGNLLALDVDARGKVMDIAAEARARLAPFAAEPLVEARAGANAIDLAQLGSGWPATRLDVTVTAGPARGGYTGMIEARNAEPGPLDASRVPVAEVRAHATLDGDVLRLEGLAARLTDGASANGNGSIDLRSGRNRWQLAVRNLDLAVIHGALARTRLAGSLDADVQQDVQVVRGDVRQDDLRLAFEARYDGREIVASRLVAAARGGEATGSGRIALDAAKTFSIDARTRRFDPSRFGRFPEGTLDGTATVRGTLAPLAIEADATVAPGSRLAGLAAQGRVQGRFTRTDVAALAADLSLGATTLRADGGYGRPGDRIAIALASKRLDELAPLLPGAPRPLAGAIDAHATVETTARGVSIALGAKGEKLAIGPDYAFATLAVDGTALVAAPLLSPRLEAIAVDALEFAATGARTPGGAVASARGRLAGNAAAHTLSLNATTEQGHVEGRLAGALATAKGRIEWTGRLESLTARDVGGIPPLALAAPVAIDVAANRVSVGAARFDAGGAQLEIDKLEWSGGALATRGRFRGLPIAPLVRQAGFESGWRSDLTLGGAWDVASAPDWRGTIRIVREGGDVYVDDPGSEGASRIALGFDTLVVDARLDGPRLTGTGELRAKLAGNTLVDFVVNAPADGRHPFTASAPLTASVRAHLPSLASLQPWLGATARMQGQAIADVSVGGVLGKPVLAGQLVGYGLRLDMPQYGINWREGRLRIASGPEGLALEEFEIAGGNGRFVASGTIALPRAGGAAGEGSRITWRAENFRALNRPDMRVVVDGQGTLAAVGRRVVVRGELRADEGNFEYRSAADTTLAEDIVVVGRPRPVREKPADVAIGDTPLELDLALDLGRDLRFAGEGLDTRLAGRLKLTSRAGGVLEGRGTIRTVRGTYWAFGQRLDIDRGRVIFDGPLANPSLDIVALRRNLAVEAGVEITGNVRAPVVRLTSRPPVPDSEKLSWLLTGGPSGSASAKEAAALSAATAALIGRGGVSLTQSVAQSIGLDEISVGQRATGAGADALEGQVVTVGKRLTDRLYIAYDQGLTIATQALRIEYVLSRFFTVAAFAGTTSGIALNFRRTWH